MANDRNRVRLAGAGRIALLLGAIAGCTGEIGNPPGGPPPSGLIDPTAELAVFSGARRLTRNEYDNTLRDLLQDETRSGFAKLPEDVTDPFDNNYTTQQASAALVEAAETLAEEASARALQNPAVLSTILPCAPAGPGDEACLRQFIASFGRKALRRSLTEEQITKYVTLQAFAVEGNDFNIGVDLVIRALLQDVEFLYRVEIGTPVLNEPGVFKLNDNEVATRLSYFLLGTTPPDELLDLADAKQLSTPEQVRAAAVTLLTRGAAVERVERFHALWLSFHQLPHAADLTAALRSESAALISRVVFEDHADYFDLFRSEETYVNDLLAEHYGLPLPGTDTGAWVSYGDTGRQGLLSHGSVLSAGAKFSDTSPTLRGKFIRNRLVCQEIPPPPANVNVDEPPGGQGNGDCKIDRYSQHASDGTCFGCHQQMDPIGFGLENYDRAGRYRATDDGAPECVISGDGALAGVGDFNGPAELADLLISSGELEKCVVTQVYRFAMGRREAKGDADLIDRLGVSFTDKEYAFDQLLIELAGSEAFGFRRQED
jgi:Protein of unknown function (DUF1588)/Protein of unknown function (DUF1592)/Protein of unknown function (DUF1595)/Protein of unknown function (DUF1585)/Protein of unknown function (DUF1587)